MESIVALHTAARRYCISLVPWLDPRAGEVDYKNPDAEPEEVEPGGDVSREEYWREELLPAILQEIERTTPEDFTSLDALRTFLVTAGREAIYVPWEERPSPYSLAKWTSAPQTEPEDLAVLSEVRERFCSYIEGLSLDDLRSVSPLPYRRTLPEEEARSIWEGLRSRWPSPSLWFLTPGDPLVGQQDMGGVLRFWWARFAQHVPLVALRSALQGAGVHRIWQVGGEDEGPYEVDVSAFVPRGEEAHFTSAGFEWVIYCDHESRIVLAGDSLVTMVLDVWADWAWYEDEGYLEA
jgi:hypothetical protein